MGVELGVGARAFHPHVEAGEVVVDVGRVDAHEAVSYTHLDVYKRQEQL